MNVSTIYLENQIGSLYKHLISVGEANANGTIVIRGSNNTKKRTSNLRGCLKSSSPLPSPPTPLLGETLSTRKPSSDTSSPTARFHPLPSLGEGSRNRRFWRGEGEGTLLLQGGEGDFLGTCVTK
jgi:hypothetical protein